MDPLDGTEDRAVVQSERRSDPVVIVRRDLTCGRADRGKYWCVVCADNGLGQAAHGIQCPWVCTSTLQCFDSEGLVVFVIDESNIEHLAAHKHDRTTNFQRLDVATYAAKQGG